MLCHMKFKTPEDLAKQNTGKDKYTLYLDNALMSELKKRAGKAGVSVSKIVNEAIGSYIAALKKND